MEDPVLPRSSSVRCMGVWIDDKLFLREHISRVQQKCFGVLTKPTAFERSFSRLLFCLMQTTVQLFSKNVLRSYRQRWRGS